MTPIYCKWEWQNGRAGIVISLIKTNAGDGSGTRRKSMDGSENEA